MAFEGLSERLQATMQKMRGKGKLTEADIKIMMREVRLALLEADVNFKVVKEFIKTVSERALGSDVMQSLTPGQQHQRQPWFVSIHRRRKLTDDIVRHKALIWPVPAYAA